VRLVRVFLKTVWLSGSAHCFGVDFGPFNGCLIQTSRFDGSKRRVSLSLGICKQSDNRRAYTAIVLVLLRSFIKLIQHRF
jgi:hypothetical protein